MCPNCLQPSVKTALKDQVKPFLSGGVVHSIHVPEMTVNFCGKCNDYTLGYEADDQIAAALKAHISQPCGC